MMKVTMDATAAFEAEVVKHTQNKRRIESAKKQLETDLDDGMDATIALRDAFMKAFEGLKNPDKHVNEAMEAISSTQQHQVETEVVHTTESVEQSDTPSIAERFSLREIIFALIGAVLAVIIAFVLLSATLGTPLAVQWPVVYWILAALMALSLIGIGVFGGSYAYHKTEGHVLETTSTTDETETLITTRP